MAKETLRVYVAGRTSPDSSFGTAHWRDEFCAELSEKTKKHIINLDQLIADTGLRFDQNNPKFIFGRNCHFIKSADLVIAHLSDDISVGGAHDMLLAKYFKKPLIGLCPLGKKFRKKSKEIEGKIYKDWIDPYVSTICDALANDIDDVARIISEGKYKKNIKYISIIDETLEDYMHTWFPGDAHAQKLTKKKK